MRNVNRCDRFAIVRNQSVMSLALFTDMLVLWLAGVTPRYKPDRIERFEIKNFDGERHVSNVGVKFNRVMIEIKRWVVPYVHGDVCESMSFYGKITIFL